MLETSRRDPIPVITCGTSFQCIRVGVAVNRGQADLADHPGRVTHRGRLHDPGKDQLEESLVVNDVEPEPVPGGLDCLDQPARALRGDQRRSLPGVAGHIQSQVEFFLAGVELAAGQLHQRGQLAVGVGRADMLDNRPATALLDRDLHRRRPRRGPNFANVRRHPPDPTDRLVPQIDNPRSRYQRKCSENPGILLNLCKSGDHHRSRRPQIHPHLRRGR